MNQPKYLSARKPRSEVYKLFLKKMLSGAKLLDGTEVEPTDLELDIMDKLHDMNYMWKTDFLLNKLKTKNGSKSITIFHLNNYKRSLIKKGLIVKNPVGEYVTNDIFRLWTTDLSENTFRIIIDIIAIDEERRIPEDNSGNLLEAELTRENSTQNSQ